MLKLAKISLKELKLESPYLKGIRESKNLQIFPASPELIKQLEIPKHYKTWYFKERYRIQSQKTNNITTYDKRLREYQNADVSFLMQFSKGAMVLNEQRTGKTPTTLVTIREKKFEKNIIIVPKSTIYQWVEEYKKWHGGHCYTTLDSWNKKRRGKAYKEMSGTLITNYNKIYTDYDEINKAFPNIDAIILDEAHYMRNFRSTDVRSRCPLSTKAIMKIRKNAKAAYPLTGTPMPNKIENIFGIMAFLHPEMFKSYWNSLDYYFALKQENNYTRGNKFWKVVDYKDPIKQKELLGYIETFSIQRKRKEVMKWLPKTEKRVIKLKPSQRQKKFIKDIKTYMETEDIMFENHLTTMMGLRQISVDPTIIGLEHKAIPPKIQYILDVMNDYPEKPIMIVSSFTRILKKLKETLMAKRKDIGIIHGSVSKLQRQNIMNDFQNKKLNIVLANIETIKVGVKLSRAEEIIFLDESLTHTDNEQTQDRIVATSKEELLNKEGQLVTILILEGSIDTYIFNALKRKKSKTEIINDYKSHIEKEEVT